VDLRALPILETAPFFRPGGRAAQGKDSNHRQTGRKARGHGPNGSRRSSHGDSPIAAPEPSARDLVILAPRIKSPGFARGGVTQARRFFKMSRIDMACGLWRDRSNTATV
jgi:hypothetical protein